LCAGSPYNIFGKDGSLGPASFEGCEIDASLFGDSLSCGRRRYSFAYARRGFGRQPALTPALSLRERVTLTRSLSLRQRKTATCFLPLRQRATLIYALSLWERARVRVLNRRRSCCFAGRQYDGDSISNGNFISYGGSDICQSSRSGRFDLHRGLVGFDLHERFALGNRLAFGLEPIEQRSFFLRDSQRRHDHVSCQINPSQQGRTFRRFKSFKPFNLFNVSLFPAILDCSDSTALHAWSAMDHPR
jgi:hypothetical protein